MFNSLVCIYALLPFELAVCVYKWASTMILLFDMWINNVVYMVMVNPVSSLSGQYVNGEGTLCTFQD